MKKRIDLAERIKKIKQTVKKDHYIQLKSIYAEWDARDFGFHLSEITDGLYEAIFDMDLHSESVRSFGTERVYTLWWMYKEDKNGFKTQTHSF